ncbi:hypothetical protein KH5H1_40430 [Corallococcus caeni]|uniref:hypothetical protein n=1 Tax=Corallococcus caeni TaxID=3082388 RepID=UPI0029569DEF|nr:hypothetical protein KH5H1_40430 [Corallococcus sp. KH5-1]
MNPNDTTAKARMGSEWIENSAATGEGTAGRTIWKVVACTGATVDIPEKDRILTVKLMADGCRPRVVTVRDLMAKYTPFKDKDDAES